MDIKEIQAAIQEMHSLNLRGNEYTQVQQRVEAFRRHVGTAYSLHSQILTNDGRSVLIKASIADKEGRVIAEGLAEELRGSSNVNKTSAIENCETSAWGRALANLGLHGGKMASVEEITIAKNKDKQIDAEAAHKNGEIIDQRKKREFFPSPPPMDNLPQHVLWIEEKILQVKSIDNLSELKIFWMKNRDELNDFGKEHPKEFEQFKGVIKSQRDKLNNGER